MIIVPDNLSEDEIAEFVKNEIINAGGDPDTAYLIDVKNENVEYVDKNEIELKISFNYENGDLL